MPTHTTDKDLGRKKFIEEYSKAKGAHVKLGFTGIKAVQTKRGDTEKGVTKVTPGLTVVQVAAFHEFGGEDNNPPERSFLRSTFDRTVRERNEFVVRLLSNIAIGKMTVERALALMGLKGVNDLKTTIREKMTTGPGDQANTESTIKRKGSSTPLIDTGQMLNSITFVKVLDGKEGE